MDNILLIGLGLNGVSLVLRAVGAKKTAAEVDKTQKRIIAWIANALQVGGTGLVAASTGGGQ